MTLILPMPKEPRKLGRPHRLTDEQESAVVELRGLGYPMSLIAEELRLDVPLSTLYHVVSRHSRRTWAHV